MPATELARYHLAQANIGRLRAPLDDPMISGFVSRLAEINALADESPGFVWRLQTENGNATSIRAYDDDLVIFNLSVWETPEQWHDFVFRSSHRDLLRLRTHWFERFDGPYSVMWWVPAGHTPSVEEARERLEHLRNRGDSPYAFPFTKLYPPPDGLE
jgi:hypothetical protein